MRALIPPPVVFLLCGALMWFADWLWPAFDARLSGHGGIFWVVFICGLLVTVSGVATILKHRTEIHPNRTALPKATHLVTDGIFHYTRNPIYLGMAIMLIGWMFRLENWLTLAGPILFVGFINSFQIQPEEEILEKLFGEEFRRYKARVRRWV